MSQQTFLLVFFLFLFGFQAGAQQSSYIQYDTQDGLPQSQVRAIAQDQKGYLWIGTVGGLSRFDGYEFQNYSTDDGLPANQINCLLQGKEHFWIGSTGSLCRQNGLGFTSIPLPESYSRSRIFDMEEDREGNLWLALAGEGVLKYDGEQFTVFDANNGLPNNYIRSLQLAPDGAMWVGTREGIVLIENDEIKPPPVTELSLPSVADILFTKDGVAVICTFGNGLILFDNKEITQFTSRSGLPSDHIRAAAELPNGELWLGAKEGLIRYEFGEFTVYTEEQGLPYSNVKTLDVDREGNLWVGTDGKGVLLQAGRSFTNYTTRDGLHSDLAMDICETDTGSLIFGSYDNGLSVFDGTDFLPYAYNDRLPDKTVWVLASDTNKTLWVGTSQGLFREQKGQTKIIDTTMGLPGDRVTSILLEGQNVWVGANDGFARLNKAGEIVETFNESVGFTGKRIRSIVKQGDNLWLGAESRVFKYDGTEFTTLQIDTAEQKPVYCIEPDMHGNIWAGTSNGLYFLGVDSSDFSRVDFGSGFSSRNINFLTLLADSTLLIGTNNGLYKLEVEAFVDDGVVRSKHYTNFEGLKTGETNQNSVYYDGDVVWFGTTSGVVRYDPTVDASGYELAPALNLSKVQLFLQDADWLRLADSVSTISGLPVNPELTFNQNYLTFYYSGIHYRNPQKVFYRYMLEGADEQWLGPTKSRSVTYAYLPHGNYTFLLQSFSIDNPDLVSEARFSFKITPPFYLTTWFFILVGLLVIGVFYAIYRNRIQVERRKRATLQLEFQSRLMVLESQTLNSSMNRHFIFNALNSIQYYINMQDRKSANRYLTSFAKLIRKNLDSSQQNETSLADELERIELYLSLEQMRFQNRFEYSIEIDKAIDPEVVEIPAMMLQPFLENSIWHGILPTEKCGHITLKITDYEEEVKIEIADNGIGIETSLRLKNGLESDHISKGMEITHNRIQLYRKMTGLNYRIEGPKELVDASGEIMGTVVYIRLPKDNQSPTEETI